MNRRIGVLAGSFLLLAGCLASLYLIGAVARAHLNGVFSTIVTETPRNGFAAFRCPRLMGRQETATVSVVIRNPAGDPLDYAVQITGGGLHVTTPAEEQRVTVPGGQTTTVAWPVTALRPGNQAIVVQAISSADSALPGPFHLWPTSFRQACGHLVLDLPLAGWQAAGLCVLGLVAGAALALPWLAGKWRARFRPNAGKR